MLEGYLAVLASIHPHDVKSDILVPVNLVDEIIRSPDDQLPLFVINKFFRIAEARAAAKFDFHKDQKPLMQHDQVDFRMFVAVIGSKQFIAFGLEPLGSQLF